MRRHADIRVDFPVPPGGNPRQAVHSMGSREWMPPMTVDRSAGTPSWFLVAFPTPVELTLDGRTGRHAKDCLVAWPPGAAHGYGHSSERWCHSWLHLSGTVVERHLAAAGVPLSTAIAGIDPGWFDEAIAALHREVSAYRQPDPDIIEAVLSILLRRIARAAVPAGASDVPGPVLELRNWIDRNHHLRLTLPGLARRAGMSVPRLCWHFRRHFQVSPVAYTIRLRLEAARLMLHDRNRTVAQVAAEVGYDDVHHFGKLYRRRFGVPPRRLR